MTDYRFKSQIGKEVALSELFGDKSELLLVHNMGKSCPYCTLWADGFIGIAKHLENRSGFAVISPDDPATQTRFAQERGWTFKMLSAKGTSFTKDMSFEPNEGEYWPGVSSFRKDEDGRMFRISKAFFGPGDDYCAVWHLFDLLPEGANGWQPKYTY